jgi:integrase
MKAIRSAASAMSFRSITNIAELAAENGFDSVGCHNYRSWLSGADAPIDVQQELMRHAQISATQQYGGPPMENQRPANSNVVRKSLPFRTAAG